MAWSGNYRRDVSVCLWGMPSLPVEPLTRSGGFKGPIDGKAQPCVDDSPQAMGTQGIDCHTSAISKKQLASSRTNGS
jgi:hypothetical protein